ncbi:hypothetical protein H6A12_07340 [Phocea massiliensis]|uniref:Cell shape-determining protein n=1 Tax=Merdimmobilis hominis TaxID=2897707 RepID=A0A938X6R5_9FIRM|nr:hypothetical protein [Merdimmobilis hominis]MBM6920963.1 hypothetical protein [Merdimmobilis hominis]
MKKTKRIVLGIAVVIVLLLAYIFFAAPNLNPLYADGAMFWLVLLTAAVIGIAVLKFKNPIAEVKDGKGVSFDFNGFPLKWVVGILAALWGIYILVHLIFNPLFFWGSYRDQMKEPEVKEFTSEIQTVDLNQIPVVDKELAQTLADKKLGEKPSLGSQVVLGEPTIQTVDGKLVWVVPLHHSGFFKWLANMDGAAGYIVVSATDMKDVHYVDSYKIKIQPDSYFMDDLTRTARFKGGLFDGITDYSFELDDSGHPYWVVTTYKNTCGFSLPEADGVLLVDAQTGETKKYSVEEVPEWIDRVQPEDFIIEQINNKGQYVHGIFNFSNKDKYQASEGSAIIYNGENCYLVTGITSVGVDESTTGFMMVDMVTKEPVLYRIGGATESAAMKSAEGKVQDLGYDASFPIIMNIDGHPTYFMTLKDSARLVKKYTFVSVTDYMTVGIGDTTTQAYEDYKKVMANTQDTPLGGEEEAPAEEKTVTGTVSRINFTVQDGKTVYYLTLTETGTQMYMAPIDVSDTLTLTQSGDSVSLTYRVSEGQQTVEVVSFENSTMTSAS